jgi:hypothetical protein
MDLPQKGHIQAEYVWIDAVGGCRCKTKVCFPYLCCSGMHGCHTVICYLDRLCTVIPDAAKNAHAYLQQ